MLFLKPVLRTGIVTRKKLGQLEENNQNKPIAVSVA
jgi:hypothetical protein